MFREETVRRKILNRFVISIPRILSAKQTLYWPNFMSRRRTRTRSYSRGKR